MKNPKHRIPQILSYFNESPRQLTIYYPETPLSLNQIIGSRGRSFKKSKIVKRWATDIEVLAYSAKVEQFIKCSINFIFNYTTRHTRDLDNLIKHPLDALVKSGLIKDDNSKVIRLPSIKIRYVPKEVGASTIINIREVL